MKKIFIIIIIVAIYYIFFNKKKENFSVKYSLANTSKNAKYYDDRKDFLYYKKCINILQELSSYNKSIIDVGSGAGFPGLPLAIVDPSLNYRLLDSNGKKIAFIKHVISLLNLKNVEAIKIRAEDYFPASGFDTVIARALTGIPNLIALTEHMLTKQGVIISLKGKNPTKELNNIPGNWKYSITKIIVPGLEEYERHIISLRNLKMQLND